MKKILVLALLATSAFGTITAKQKYELNKWMGPVALRNGLGDRIADAGAGSTLANGKIFVGNASNVSTAVTPSGDVTITNAGVTAIGATKVTNAMLAGSITLANLEALASGKVIVGSAGNVATAVTPSGDVTVTNAGVTAIGAGKVTNAMQDGTVLKYTDTTITSANVKLLFTTPQVLVAAPGAGFVNLVSRVYATLTYGTAAYSTDAAGFTVRYTNGAGASVGATLTQAFAQASASTRLSVGAAATALVPVDNGAIVLYADNSNPTTGDSPLKVRVYYTVAPNPLP